MADLFSTWKRMFLFITIWIGKTESLRNLALRKQAYQTGDVGDFSADKAVDGGLSPYLESNSCTHTPLVEQAFWEVDLESTSIIDHVTIYNRNYTTNLDEYDRLRDVELYIGLSKEDYKLEGFHEGQVEATCTFQLRKHVIGRWVRITRSPSVYDYLTLCEVQVYGYIIKGNIALGKQAYQTGVFEDWSADRAVDGGLSPYHEDRSCSSTPLLEQAYWEVDLGSTSIIEHVTIINRNYTTYLDEYDRLRDVELYIGMQNKDYKLEGFHEGQVDAICTFQVRKHVIGRWVRITRSPSVNDYLTLCEVQVYGYIIKDFSIYPQFMGNGTIIQILETNTPVQCGFYCFKTSSCSAANYHASKNQCDLLLLSSANASVDGVALIAYEYGLLKT